jgi:carboxyl-terminal processing protease
VFRIGGPVWVRRTYFMKLIQCAFCIVCLFAPLLTPGQRHGSQPASRLTEPEPFRIGSGSSFSASAPGRTAAGKPIGSNAERTKIINDIREAEELIAQNYAGGKPRTADLTHSALTSLLHVLDPHSNYFDALEWKELLDEQQSGYAGIGTSISAFSVGGRTDTYIVSTFEGTAARRAQMRFGDRIVAVNGERMDGKTIDEVRDKIRGPIGSAVRVTVERSDTKRLETIELRRGIVAQPSIPDSYLIRPGVGYIDLSEGFNYTTSDEFDKAVSDLQRQGMRSLVLDIRGNGGGLVDQAIKVAERFLPAGSLIVTQRGRTPVDDRVWRSANRSPLTMPLVLLVDENTASASEIVAGALQDQDRAFIIGEKTFGKGLVQNVIDLPFKTGLTLTAARYYTPSGRSIQRDYDHIGRYDYFSHNGQAAAIDKPYFESKTVTGRRMLGGDGIVPDDTITSADLTNRQSVLLDPIFFFATDLVNGRISGLNADASDAAIFDAFSAYAVGHRTSVLAEREFVTLQIRHQIATARLGTVPARRVLIAADPQVAAALSSLPRAAQLFRTASAVKQRP